MFAAFLARQMRTFAIAQMDSRTCCVVVEHRDWIEAVRCSDSHLSMLLASFDRYDTIACLGANGHRVLKNDFEVMFETHTRAPVIGKFRAANASYKCVVSLQKNVHSKRIRACNKGSCSLEYFR